MQQLSHSRRPKVQGTDSTGGILQLRQVVCSQRNFKENDTSTSEDDRSRLSASRVGIVNLSVAEGLRH